MEKSIGSVDSSILLYIKDIIGCLYMCVCFGGFIATPTHKSEGVDEMTYKDTQTS